MKGPKGVAGTRSTGTGTFVTASLVTGAADTWRPHWSTHYFSMSSGQQLIFQRIDDSVVNGCLEKVVYLSLEITHSSGGLMLRSESPMALLRKPASCQSS